MSISRVAKERRERDPEGSRKNETMTVSRTDYINMLSALEEACELSRDLWFQIRAFERVCSACSGCADGAGIVAGFRETHERIGHILARGKKGKAYHRIGVP